MKLLLSYVYAGLLTVVHAKAPVASVYDFEPTSKQPRDSLVADVVPPETARLILAQRFGLSQYHSLKGTDEETLRHLNELGGSQQLLLEEEESHRGKFLVIVEGVQNPDRIFKPQNGISPAFRISDPPVSSANSKLVHDLLLQESHRRGPSTSCITELAASSELQGGLSMHRDSQGNCNMPDHIPTTAGILQSVVGIARTIGADEAALLHVTFLEIIGRQEGVNSAAYAQAEEALARTFQHLSDTSHILESTIILMPAPTRNAKRSSNPYGVYEVPGKTLQARQFQPEELLSEAPAPAPSSSPSHESRPSQPQTLKASALPAGIIPICHSSHDACVAATNNCTGRGSCYKKYSSAEGDAKASDCYACGCIATVRENKSGSKKTTQWAGSACQKKDVSMPFLLIAGFTIVMVATVSWGVGLLFSIGQETLPSVIGAGVAGPRAQK
ncbi:hypothetical protein MMC16_000372 [Acarospora aff. strigata]|nr:hypothetical protein [Acarospora aff. strigata]